MNKTEFAQVFYDHFEGRITHQDTKDIIDIFTDTITEKLAQGEEVALQSFGKFYISERSARKGHNPQTGEPMDIPAHVVPRFKASVKLKEFIRENE